MHDEVIGRDFFPLPDNLLYNFSRLFLFRFLGLFLLLLFLILTIIATILVTFRGRHTTFFLFHTLCFVLLLAF